MCDSEVMFVASCRLIQGAIRVKVHRIERPHATSCVLFAPVTCTPTDAYNVARVRGVKKIIITRVRRKKEKKEKETGGCFTSKGMLRNGTLLKLEGIRIIYSARIYILRALKFQFRGVRYLIDGSIAEDTRFDDKSRATGRKLQSHRDGVYIGVLFVLL